MSDLRKQVFLALTGWVKVVDGETVEDYEVQTDAVIALIAERERVLAKDAWHDGYSAGVTAARQGLVPGVARVDELRARIEAIEPVVVFGGKALPRDEVLATLMLAVFDD